MILIEENSKKFNKDTDDMMSFEKCKHLNMTYLGDNVLVAFQDMVLYTLKGILFPLVGLPLF